jgi:hypothetical protein
VIAPFVLALLLGERTVGSELAQKGASIVAVPLLQDARDRALRAVGAKDPRLAPFDDALAVGLAARGRIRDAMRYHRESIALGETPAALAARARTEIEGGELHAAFADLQRASELGGDIGAVLGEAVGAARDVPNWATAKPLVAPPLTAAEAQAAVADLGEEPTRTALRVYIALARTGNVQAARAAISVYQALPELARTDYDEMWNMTTR